MLGGALVAGNRLGPAAGGVAPKRELPVPAGGDVEGSVADDEGAAVDGSELDAPPAAGPAVEGAAVEGTVVDGTAEEGAAVEGRGPS